MYEVNKKMRGFSWLDYEHLLNEFLDSGYAFCEYSDLDPTKRHVVLRHDVDFSMEAALNIALIESNFGIKAYYFILLRTEFYNLCSPADWNIIKKIVNLGHSIGLHFDASQYEDDIHVLQKAAQKECEILENVISAPVKAISFHRPIKSLQGMSDRLADRLHAYMPRFFSEIAYYSDSQGAFRFGHPLDSEAFKNKTAMQLLTHPIWWSKEIVDDRLSLIDQFLEKRRSLLCSEAMANCIPYAQRISRKNKWL